MACGGGGAKPQRVGAAAGGPGYDKRRKIFGIFLIDSLGALSAFRSVSLAGAARQQPSSHCGCTEGTAPSASTRIAPHWTSQRQPTHNDAAAARRHRARRSLRWARTRRASAGCAGAPEACICAHALPHPRDRNLPCKSAARQEHGEQGRLTGDLLAHRREDNTRPIAWPSAPPSKGGRRGTGRAVPRGPSTPSCGGTSNCRNECTSHGPASSSPSAGVEYIPARDA